MSRGWEQLQQNCAPQWQDPVGITSTAFLFRAKLGLDSSTVFRNATLQIDQRLRTKLEETEVPPLICLFSSLSGCFVSVVSAGWLEQKKKSVFTRQTLSDDSFCCVRFVVCVLSCAFYRGDVRSNYEPQIS